MKAIVITRRLPLDDPQCFVEIDLPVPEPGPRDLLVRVKAVSVNPVDYKVRRRRAPADTKPAILGWDAAGVVESVGSETTLFKPGDAVFYAGDITRPGSNAEFQLVDERIAGRKPSKLSFAEAAALPLTSITAWETLFDRFRVPLEHPASADDRVLLILGGAGGVGSIAIQLARQLSRITIIATASRPESSAWCRKLGAHHVVNHLGDWPAEMKQLGYPEADYIACFNDTITHWERMAAAIRPQGLICSIVEAGQQFDLNLIRSKSAGFLWELMFTRPMYQTKDMIEQHRLLNRVAELLDAGRLQTTLRETLGPMTPANVAEAHRRLESNRTIGKLVLTLE
jgi:NADPH2:quinone reductase